MDLRGSMRFVVKCMIFHDVRMAPSLGVRCVISRRTSILNRNSGFFWDVFSVFWIACRFSLGLGEVTNGLTESVMNKAL